MSGPRRAAAVVLEVVSLGLVVAGTLWCYYQLLHTIDFIRGLLVQNPPGVTFEDARALTQSSRIPSWIEPFLVDLSLVTPGLIAFTGVWMAYGAATVLTPAVRRLSFTQVSFPFPDGSRAFCVQSGLIGTVFGMILAFHDADRETQNQSAILLEALGTALWSTLTALVLAFAVWPVVEFAYQRLHQPQRSYETDPLLALRTSVANTAAAFQQLESSAMVLNRQLAHDELLRRVAEMDGRINGLEGQIASLRAQNTRIEESVTLEREKRQALQQDLDRMEVRLSEAAKAAEARTRRWNGTVAVLEEHLQQLRRSLRGMLE